jgi:hypothetical protein
MDRQSCGCSHWTRRAVLASVTAFAGAGIPLVQAAPGTPAIPASVAGIAIPQSAFARKAMEYSRSVCPAFLFNHCMRTYLFGALFAQKQKLAFNADVAFAAAALHDLGLLQKFESAHGSFEIDGADTAEKFALGDGHTKTVSDLIWHAVEMHDGHWPLTKRQGPEAMVVSFGAGSDVDGPDDHFASPVEVAAIVAAFPRLHFKKRFTALAIDHCKRKPLSQQGTWLEGLCREQAPAAWTDTVEKEIATAPFSE